MTVLQSDDTLIIKAGIYNQYLHITVSGTAGHPITFSSEGYAAGGNPPNDGDVVIDQSGAGGDACDIDGQSYVDLNGVICKANAQGTAHALYAGSKGDYDHLPIIEGHDINIRRVSAYDAYTNIHDNGGHAAVAQISGVETSANGGLSFGYNILLEDCIVYTPYGNGYIAIDSLSATNVTIRRCFAYTADPAIVFYETENSKMENNIAIYQAGGSPYNVSHGMQINASSHDFGQDDQILGNMTIGADSGYTFYDGATISDRTGSGQRIGKNGVIKNNFVINTNNAGILQNSGTGAVISNNTIVLKRTNIPANPPSDFYVGLYLSPWTTDPISTTVANNSIVGNNRQADYGFAMDGSALTPTRQNNNIFNTYQPYGGSANPSAGSGDSATDPAYPVSTYGLGAYLDSSLSGISGKGATILYEYQDGTLTGNHLWPWPMESRIVAELGSSGVIAPLGLSVMDTIWPNGNYSGRYSGGGDTTPPAAPSGLNVS